MGAKILGSFGIFLLRWLRHVGIRSVLLNQVNVSWVGTFLRGQEVSVSTTQHICQGVLTDIPKTHRLNRAEATWPVSVHLLTIYFFKKE